MKPCKLPFSLPPAPPMPFDADPPAAPDLFDKPALPVMRCEPLARIWSKSASRMDAEDSKLAA